MSEFATKIASRFGIDKIGTYLADLIPDVLAALATFAFFYLLWKLLAAILRAAMGRAKVDKTAQAFVQLMVKYTLLIVGMVAALGEVGVNTGSLLASLGIAGLTIGFAARDSLSNVISGVFIFWDRPFVIGDLVEVDGKYGRVERITMRSTRVVTVDGKMLAVPNSQIINTIVTSYSNFPHLRLDIDVTIGTGEDLGRVREMLLDLVLPDDRFLKEPAPSVVVTALNDYNVAVQLRAWLDDEAQHVAVRFELRERVFETLRAAGVDLPFETIQLRPIDIRQAEKAI